MTNDQFTIIAILIVTMAMFIWGRWRYDLVAGGALLVCVYLGLISASDAFQGFGNPAVITVACVLVLSHGLQSSGVVDALAGWLIPKSAGMMVSIAILTTLAALLSAFMNNVGALSLLMPIAIQMSSRLKLSPGKILMPVAFASILGGTTTLIGTPPNIIISGYRVDAGLGTFGMFDFTPVGLAVTAVGVAFIILIGWRLVPSRKRDDTATFDTGNYFTEVKVIEDSKINGKTLRAVDNLLNESDAQLIGFVRGDVRVIAPNMRRVVKAEDILIIEIDPSSISSVCSNLRVNLVGNVEASANYDSHQKDAELEKNENNSEKRKISEDVVIQEYVTMPTSGLIGRSASDIELRSRFNINLLAISHQGLRSMKRLRSAKILAGDVLLLQGTPEALSTFSSNFNCIPLAPRDIRIPIRGKSLIATVIMLGAITLTAVGLLSAPVAFASGVIAMIVTKIVPLRNIYNVIDWPIIILLGAMLPVAEAMGSTGTADVIARFLIANLTQGNPVIGLGVIMVVTMILTDFMNNAATAAVMCPIALSTASQLGVNPDTFLMAVAIGASCAFLTPIGHQNNTLIMGPGGFRFGDYWRMGLPTDILVVLVALPMLIRVWPL